MSGAPSGLVLYTSNASQSYGETEEMLTCDDILACEVEDFAEYIDELAEKAILLRHREEPGKGCHNQAVR